MTTQIALLRAVNVGGTGKIAMTDLRSFFSELGFGDVRSLLQTGNIVFDSDARAGAELETFLEEEARGRLGLDTSFLIRTPGEWEAAIKANPFTEATRDNPAHLLVMALKDAPDTAAVKALEAAISGQERIHASGRQLYIDYRDGIGRSKLTNVLIERKLGTRGTARNWNTALKIAGLARE